MKERKRAELENLSIEDSIRKDSRNRLCQYVDGWLVSVQLPQYVEADTYRMQAQDHPSSMYEVIVPIPPRLPRSFLCYVKASLVSRHVRFP